MARKYAYIVESGQEFEGVQQPILALQMPSIACHHAGIRQ